MASFLDNCRFLPTLGGLTDWTYSSAVIGYQGPVPAGVVNGAVYRYRAENVSLTEWEIGYGIYNTTTGVLTRLVVMFNSAGTQSKINFSSVPQVSIIALAEDLVRPNTPQPGGRLTLTPGVPETSADVTNAATIYYTPGAASIGNFISLYDGSNWVPTPFAETPLSIAGLAVGTYDLWGRPSSGALALDTTAWTSDTLRATAVTQQDGIDVKSGDPTRRLLGSFSVYATGKTEDSKIKRLVSNRYNERPRPLLVTDPATTWPYTGAAWRQAHNNPANQFEVVFCVERPLVAAVLGIGFISTQSSPASAITVAVGIGIDTVPSATQSSLQLGASMSAQASAAHAFYLGSPGIGRRKVLWCEYGPDAASAFVTTGGVASWQGTILPWNIAGLSGMVNN